VKQEFIVMKISHRVAGSFRLSIYLYISLLQLQSYIGDVAGNILVVGSINADTFLPVARLPVEGENVSCFCFIVAFVFVQRMPFNIDSPLYSKLTYSQ